MLSRMLYYKGNMDGFDGDVTDSGFMCPTLSFGIAFFLALVGPAQADHHRVKRRSARTVLGFSAGLR